MYPKKEYALKNTGIKVMEFIPPVTDTGMTTKRDEHKMSAYDLIQKIMPQILNERQVVTMTSIRIFKWIALLSPGLANKILSK